MSFAIRRVRGYLLAGTSLVVVSPAHAQSTPNLPPVTVEAPQQKPKAATRAIRPGSQAERVARNTRAPQPNATPAAQSGSAGSGSLTVPNTAQAIAEIDRIPGGVEVVPDTAY